MFDAFNYWDLVLLLVVLAMAVPLAYIPQVKYKAFIMSLPFPGTVALLSLGQHVNASNILGLSLLLLFAHIVRFLYYHRLAGIIPSIAVAAMTYGILGGWLNRIYPMTTAGFYAAATWNFLLAFAILAFTSPHREPGQKSHLPVVVKIAIVTTVIAGLIILKKMIGGFMVAFPMVSLIAMYESRYSLWSVCRQMAIVMTTLGLLFFTIFLLQDTIGLHLSIVCGWVVFLMVIIPMHRQNFPSENRNAPQDNPKRNNTTLAPGGGDRTQPRVKRTPPA